MSETAQLKCRLCGEPMPDCTPTPPARSEVEGLSDTEIEKWCEPGTRFTSLTDNDKYRLVVRLATALRSSLSEHERLLGGDGFTDAQKSMTQRERDAWAWGKYWQEKAHKFMESDSDGGWW